MKLLAKTATKSDTQKLRAGLEADLRRCQTEWQAHRRIAAFPLGSHDLPERLLIPERLYGREREVQNVEWRPTTVWWRMAPRSSFWYQDIPALARPQR